MVMKRYILLVCLFLYFASFSQDKDFLKSVSNIDVLKQKEHKIVAYELQIAEKEIFRILEAAIVYGENYKTKSSFYVTISLQDNGFQASVSQAENFDFFPTNSEHLRGYIHYKNAYFFVFCSQENNYFIPSKNQKTFTVKKSFSCVPHPAKKYEFSEGKIYQVEHLFDKEHKKLLRIWVNEIDGQKE